MSIKYRCELCDSKVNYPDLVVRIGGQGAFYPIEIKSRIKLNKKLCKECADTIIEFIDSLEV